MKKWIKVLSGLLAVLLVACIGLVAWMYSIYKGISEDPFSAFKKPSTGSTITVKDSQNVEHTQTEGVVNILLLGIDSNAEREAAHKGYRSDTMILCSFDFSNNRLNMISVPRDTRTKVNKLDYDTGEVVDQTTNRINTAYTFGGGPDHYGAQNAMDCMEEFLSCDGKFDIPIDYYVSIDLDGLPKLAESLGGVEVVLDRTLSGIGKKGETVTINKKNIDDYLRRRYDDGGGDDGRAARQQEFIEAVIKKIQKMGAVQAAPKLFNDVLAYTKTNLTMEQIIALATFADGFDMDTINRYRVTGTGKTFGGAWMLEADMDGLYDFILEEFYDPVA